MMKYHPESQTIVPPFNESLFPISELVALVIMYPDMQAGDTMVAKVPQPMGDGYVLEYEVLVAGSPEQTAYFEGL